MLLFTLSYLNYEIFCPFSRIIPDIEIARILIQLLIRLLKELLISVNLAQVALNFLNQLF